MWIIKLLNICNYEVLENSVEGYFTEREAKESFTNMIKDFTEFSLEEGLEIETSTSTHFAAIEKGAAGKNAIYITVEELVMGG